MGQLSSDAVISIGSCSMYEGTNISSILTLTS